MFVLEARGAYAVFVLGVRGADFYLEAKRMIGDVVRNEAGQFGVVAEIWMRRLVSIIRVRAR